MLVLPFCRHSDWKSPPIVVLSIIALNTLVYFFLQNYDRQYQRESYRYYFKSELHRIEFPRYLEYRQQLQQEVSRKQKSKIKRMSTRSRLYLQLNNDTAFLKRLHNNQIIQPQEQIYLQWKAKRSHFEFLIDKVLIFHYGLTPAKNTWYSSLTYQFLHGSASHLFWNMVFLLIVGFAVEKIIGARAFLISYLLSGVMAAQFYVLLDPSNPVPTIGASGSITAVMAMYVVLFGLRKINYFYFLFFYFGIKRAPAIWILPFWVGYELYQWLSSSYSNVNYLAHIGGFLSGALIAGLIKCIPKYVDKEFLDYETNQLEYEKQLSLALEYMASLNFDDAKAILKQLKQSKPNDPQLLEYYYAVLKNLAVCTDYHETVHEILAQSVQDKNRAEKHYAIYQQYLAKTGSNARLRVELLIHLVRTFSKYGLLVGAESILRTLLKYRGEHEQIPTLLYLFANACNKRHQPDKAKQYLQLLTHHYQHSEEAQIAKRMVKKYG